MKTSLFLISIAIVVGIGALLLYAAPTPQSIAHQPASLSETPSSTQMLTERTGPLAITTHTIGQVSLSPTVVSAGTFQPFKVTAVITDPALIATSVNLLYSQVGSNAWMILGTLHDDGLNGDAIAGDGVYTLVFTLPSSTAMWQAIDFQISAAFLGSLVRTKSSLIPVTIQQPPDMTGWQTLSDSNDLFTISVPQSWDLRVVEVQNPYPDTLKTCQFLFPDGSAAFYIDVYTTAGWQDLISSGGGITPLLIGTSTAYYFSVEQPQDIEGTQGLTAAQEVSELPAIYSTFKAQ